MWLELFSPRECPGLYAGARFFREASIVLLPVGSYEDRPYGPFTLDTLFSLSVACRASKWCRALVLWPIGYGYSPAHRLWLGFPPRMLREVLRAVIGEASRLGRKVVVVDGHYGHKSLVEEAVSEKNAVYINLWSALSSVFEDFQEQLGFERMLADYFETGGAERSVVERVIGVLARLVCGEIGYAQRTL